MTEETNLQVETPAEGAPPVVEQPEIVESPPTTDAQDNAETNTSEDDKPKGGFQRRISELTRNWREAERRNDELIALLQRGQQPEPAQEPAAPPTLAEFNFDESKYQQAVLDFARKHATEAAKSEIQTWQQQQREQAKVETFRSRETEFAATVEDYADVVYDPSAPISAPMAEVIRESDVGPQLAYYLAKNRAEATRIAGMPPIAAARELGRIEAKLSQPAPKPVAPSKAPPPPPKVDAGEDVVGDDDLEKMPLERFFKVREKQLRKQGRR